MKNERGNTLWAVVWGCLLTIVLGASLVGQVGTGPYPARSIGQPKQPPR
jgi:hypothetical protein